MPTGEPDDPSQISINLPCWSCGYNLRMLPTAGRCPECGLPIVEGLRRYATRQARPALRRQHWRTVLLCAGLMAVAVASLVAIVGRARAAQPPDLGLAVAVALLLGCAITSVQLTRRITDLPSTPLVRAAVGLLLVVGMVVTLIGVLVAIGLLLWLLREPMR